MIRIIKNLMSDSFIVVLQNIDDVDYCYSYGDSNNEKFDSRMFQGNVVESNIHNDYYYDHDEESNDEDFGARIPHGDVVEIDIGDDDDDDCYDHDNDNDDEFDTRKFHRDTAGHDDVDDYDNYYEDE